MRYFDCTITTKLTCIMALLNLQKISVFSESLLNVDVFLFCFQFGIPNSFALASYTRKIEKNTKLKGAIK